MAKHSYTVSLKQFIFRRFLLAIPLVIGVIMFTFVLVHIAPGDPVTFIAGELGADPDYILEIREKYGLNKPLTEQLSTYLGKVFRGDLGYSILYRMPVLKLILERVPATLLLMGTSLSLAAIIGVLLGVFSSRNPFHLFDNIISSISLAGYSIPYFWSAIMLISIFAVRLGLLPSGGIVSLRETATGWNYYLDVGVHLILPTFSLAFYQIALLARLTRGTMLDVLREDYILTARSKGLSEHRVFFLHALRNAIIPVITVLGYQFGSMFSGAIITETIYTWPGLGRLLYDAILALDYPIILGMIIFITISMVSVTLLTDVILAIIDPRIRYQ